jgi:hypothetical protein
VEGVDAVNGFHFNHDSAFDHQVDSVSHLELMALIDYGHGPFSWDFETAASQFVRQTSSQK